MKLPLDHDVRVWMDSNMYVALHHLARDDDRAMSEYIRHVLALHIKQVSFHDRYDASPKSGPARDGERS